MEGCYDGSVSFVPHLGVGRVNDSLHQFDPLFFAPFRQRYHHAVPCGLYAARLDILISRWLIGCNFDGAVSKLGLQVPMLIADGACGMLPDPMPDPSQRPPNVTGCMESFGTSNAFDNSGATLAFPADLNDPNLTVWVKDGPLNVEYCAVDGGPNPLWQSPPGVWNMLMMGNNSEARYTTTDPGFKQWRLADPCFLPERAGAGALWHRCVQLWPNIYYYYYCYC